MTPDEIKNWTLIGLAVWNAGLTVVLWLRKPGEEAGAAVDVLRGEHGKQLTDLRKDMVQIQTELKHMPTSEELAQLEGTVKQINQRTEGMAENMGTVRLQLNRIEQYLLDRK